MAENMKEPLDVLLKRYWCDQIRDLAKTDSMGGKFDYFGNPNALILKLKVFSNSLGDFVSELKEYHSDAKYFLFKGRRRLEIIRLKLMPKPIRDRSKLELTLSINLMTRKSYVFLYSKIGLTKGNFITVSVEDIENLDVEATLDNMRAWAVDYQKNKANAERIAEEKRIEELKQKKLAEMASKSIETIVPQMMAESGYEWNLESEYKHYGCGGVPERYILRIKTKSHKMIEITLSQKNFAKKIPEILNVVHQIEQLLEQAPFAVNILNYGPGTRWRKGTEYVEKLF